MELLELAQERFLQIEAPFQRKALAKLKKEFVSLLEDSLLSSTKKDYILHQLNNIHEIKDLMEFLSEINQTESEKEIYDLFTFTNTDLKLSCIRMIKSQIQNQQINQVQEFILSRDLTALSVMISGKLNLALALILKMLSTEVKELTLYYHSDYQDSVKLREFLNLLPQNVIEKLAITSSLADAQTADIILGTDSPALNLIRDSASQNEIIILDT